MMCVLRQQLTACATVQFDSGIKQWLKHYHWINSIRKHEEEYVLNPSPNISMNMNSFDYFNKLLLSNFIFDLTRLSWWAKVLFAQIPTYTDVSMHNGSLRQISEMNDSPVLLAAAALLTLISLLMCAQVWQDSVSKGHSGQDNQQM